MRQEIDALRPLLLIGAIRSKDSGEEIREIENPILLFHLTIMQDDGLAYLFGEPLLELSQRFDALARGAFDFDGNDFALLADQEVDLKVDMAVFVHSLVEKEPMAIAP